MCYFRSMGVIWLMNLFSYTVNMILDPVDISSSASSNYTRRKDPQIWLNHGRPKRIDYEYSKTSLEGQLIWTNLLAFHTSPLNVICWGPNGQSRHVWDFIKTSAKKWLYINVGICMCMYTLTWYNWKGNRNEINTLFIIADKRS